MSVNQVRSRGLPEDHAGPIRIIDIEGIDANMCCGTHVSNLSHLQVQLHSLAHTHVLRCVLYDSWIILKASDGIKLYIQSKKNHRNKICYSVLIRQTTQSHTQVFYLGNCKRKKMF